MASFFLKKMCLTQKILISTIVDLQKLYYSNVLNPNDEDPACLQNKVQFDIRFYFCQQGNENIYDFTKETFKVKEDLNSGLKYIMKVQDDKKPQWNKQWAHHCHYDRDTRPSTLSSQKLLEVHPTPPPWLWISLAKTKEERTLYRHGYLVLQQKSLQQLLVFTPLQAFPLSRVYTNHSIRVTAATFLKCNKFSDNQIMAITGHHSVTSLSLYEKVSTEEKLLMGKAMN